MEYGDLLAPLKMRHIAIAHGGQLPKGLVELQQYLSSTPRHWEFRFFGDGNELSAALEKGLHSIGIPNDVSHLLVVLPDDMAVQPGQVNSLALRNNVRILMIVGRALRSEENRRRVFYVKGR